MATPWDQKSAETYTQPVEVQNNLNWLAYMMTVSQQRLAALKAVHDPLAEAGASPVGEDEALLVATGQAITQEVEIQRQIDEFERRVNRWALNDKSYWAVKLPRPAFPVPPPELAALVFGFPPLPHLQAGAYFKGMREGVALVVAEGTAKQNALAQIEQLEKSA